MHRIELLKKAVGQYGQSAVARALAYSTSAISQVLNGKYKGSLDHILERAAAVYGTDPVACPVMGKISRQRCEAERQKPFAVSSPQRVKLYRACRQCQARKTGEPP